MTVALRAGASPGLEEAGGGGGGGTLASEFSSTLASGHSARDLKVNEAAEQTEADWHVRVHDAIAATERTVASIRDFCANHLGVLPRHDALSGLMGATVS